jgi:hypothetical protein
MVCNIGQAQNKLLIPDTTLAIPIKEQETKITAN